MLERGNNRELPTRTQSLLFRDIQFIFIVTPTPEPRGVACVIKQTRYGRDPHPRSPPRPASSASRRIAPDDPTLQPDLNAPRLRLAQRAAIETRI
jgi:hypothetical protein